MAMEISLLYLMECAHSNAKELQAYEAESEGCYEGSVADAFKIILHVSLRKHDAMESVGDCFRNLSIQGTKEVCAAAPVSIPGTPRKREAEDEAEPLLVLSPIQGTKEVARSDSIAGTPKKRRASQQEPMEDQPVEQEPLLVLFGAPIGGVVNRDR